MLESKRAAQAESDAQGHRDEEGEEEDPDAMKQ